MYAGGVASPGPAVLGFFVAEYAGFPEHQSVAASRWIKLAQSWTMPWTIPNLLLHDKPLPLSDQRASGYAHVFAYCFNPGRCHNA